MAHPMLTKRDYLRGEAFNKILTACKVEPMNYTLLSDLLSPMSPETIKNHCETLMFEGYMTCEVKRFGKFKRLSNFYTTVIDHYSMDSMIPSSVKVRATMMANGTTYNNNGGRHTEAAKPSHIRIINFESNSSEAIELREKHRQQSQLSRREMKSKKNYVSGSTLSAAI